MGILLLALLIGTLAALIFVVLLGAFLIWIPVAILLFVAAVVGGLMRRYFLALEHDLVNSNHALRHARACRGHPRLSGGASKTWMEGT
jgi:hypothetical protein